MLATLLLAAATVGQVQCRTVAGPVVQRQFSYQAVQQQVAYPVVQQQVAYSYQYYQPQALFVPVIYEDPLVLGVAGHEQRKDALFGAKASAVEGLSAEVSKLAAAVAKLQAPPTATPAPIPNTPPVAVEPPPAPVPDPPAEAGDPQILARATTILRNKCSKCHSEAKADGGIALFDKNGRLADLSPAQIQLVDIATYAGEMPPTGQLDPEAYRAIRAWVDQSREKIRTSLKNQGK